MIRIRFFGPEELFQKGFRAALFSGLDPHGAQAARQEGWTLLRYFEGWSLHPFVMHSSNGPKTLWCQIDRSQGDAKWPERPGGRVAQETRRRSAIEIEDIAAVTSSTPPLEMVRLLCSLMMYGEPRVEGIISTWKRHQR